MTAQFKTTFPEPARDELNQEVGRGTAREYTLPMDPS